MNSHKVAVRLAAEQTFRITLTLKSLPLPYVYL